MPDSTMIKPERRHTTHGCKEPSVRVEPVFAALRHNNHFNRFTLRGKCKVNAQSHLCCMVHSIEQIANYGLAQLAGATCERQRASSTLESINCGSNLKCCAGSLNWQDEYARQHTD
jgi:Transposase DDE domain